MPGVPQAAAIRGKTVRLSWTDGPTKGTTHEHVFHEDGTVEWHDVKSPSKGPAKERPPYAAYEVADGIYAVSYLAAGSGYTLTVVLNLRNQRVVGFASSAKEWYPVQGSMEVVG